nr:unnamed protein product [Digitaria exilis]
MPAQGHKLPDRVTPWVTTCRVPNYGVPQITAQAGPARRPQGEAQGRGGPRKAYNVGTTKRGISVSFGGTPCPRTRISVSFEGIPCPRTGFRHGRPSPCGRDPQAGLEGPTPNAINAGHDRTLRFATPRMGHRSPPTEPGTVPLSQALPYHDINNSTTRMTKRHDAASTLDQHPSKQWLANKKSAMATFMPSARVGRRDSRSHNARRGQHSASRNVSTTNTHERPPSPLVYKRGGKPMQQGHDKHAHAKKEAIRSPTQIRFTQTYHRDLRQHEIRCYAPLLDVRPHDRNQDKTLAPTPRDFPTRKWVSARPFPDAPRRLHLVELRPNAKGLSSLAQPPSPSPFLFESSNSNDYFTPRRPLETNALDGRPVELVVAFQRPCGFYGKNRGSGRPVGPLRNDKELPASSVKELPASSVTEREQYSPSLVSQGAKPLIMTSL